MNERRDWAPVNWSPMKRLIYLRGNGATGGGGGSPLTVSGPTPLLMPGAVAKPMRAATFAISPVQSGSGDPSLSNVRPITGWTGCTAWVTGRNLFDINNPYFTAGTPNAISNYKSKVENSTLYNGGKIGVTDGGGITIPVIPGTYTLSFTINGEIANYEIRAVTVGTDDIWTTYTILKQSRGAREGYQTETITFPSGYTHLVFLAYSATRFGSWETNVMIEPGGVAHSYTPYSGSSLSVEFPASVGTVYSGTIDPVTGQGVVTHVCKDMGEMGWFYRSSILAFSYLVDPEVKASLDYGTVPNIYCSQYKTASINGMQNSDNCCTVGRQNYYLGSVIVKDTRYSDATAFKTAMSGVQLVYELATPIPFTITPQSLTPPAGDAYIWADCGSSAEVIYIGKA